tara:strand:- start:163 stop:324 length:162 start_codon:yes stop_codon:yes gene_type:complete
MQLLDLELGVHNPDYLAMDLLVAHYHYQQHSLLVKMHRLQNLHHLQLWLELHL